MGKLFSRVQQSVSGIPGTGDATMGSAVSGGFQTLAAAGAVTGDLVDGYFIDGTAWEARRDIPYSSTGPTLPRAAGTFAGSSTGSVLSLTSSAVFISNPVPASLMTPDLFGTPGAPQSGLVRLGESPFANCDIPSFRTARTLERLLLPWNMRTRHWGIFCTASQNRGIGVNDSFTLQANQTGPGYGAGSYFLRQNRNHFRTTTTTNGVGALYLSVPAPQEFLGTGSNSRGFLACFRFGVSTAVTGHRFFVGLSNATAAPTNVAPQSVTNQIGFAAISGSNNLQVVFGGTTAQTPVDLGANFPVNTSGVDWYEGWLFSDANDNSRVDYTVVRWTGDDNRPANTISGTLNNGTPGTTLPSTTTGLVARAWITNDQTAADATLAVGSMQVWAE